jgi:hypothetical protein
MTQPPLLQPPKNLRKSYARPSGGEIEVDQPKGIKWTDQTPRNAPISQQMDKPSWQNQKKFVRSDVKREKNEPRHIPLDSETLFSLAISSRGTN